MKTTIIYEGEVIYQLPQFDVNDYGGVLTFHVKEEDNSAYDLTDKSVSFKCKKLNKYNEYLFTGGCSITDDEAGYCTYTFTDSDLSEEGSYECSLEITETDTSKSSIILGYLNINEDN